MREHAARRCPSILVSGVLSVLVFGGMAHADRVAMESARSGGDQPAAQSARADSSHYQRLIKFPLQNRRSEFAKLSAKEKSAVWRAQLHSYRESHPSLSTEQQELLEQAITLAEPGFFGASRGETRKLSPQVEELANRFRRAFGDAEAAALLLRLGPAEDPTSSPTASASSSDCNCQVGGAVNSCVWFRGERCVDSGCNPISGCGFFWRDGCDGTCIR
jgi:hypothetical protein